MAIGVHDVEWPLEPKRAWELGFIPAKVLVDGVEIEHVWNVHVPEGWIEKYVTDEDGHIKLFLGENDDPETRLERVYGRVTYIPYGREPLSSE